MSTRSWTTHLVAVTLAACSTPAVAPTGLGTDAAADVLADTAMDAAPDVPADATSTDAAATDTDSTPVPYPAVPATLPVQLTGCDASFAFQMLAPDTRPASRAPCYDPQLPLGAGLGCLPWEWCDKELHLELGQPWSEATYGGSLQCMRPCEAKDAGCPEGTTCGPFNYVDGDVGLTLQVCTGGAAGEGATWPSYTKTSAPAEGRLGCWAPLAQLKVYVDATYLARVGPHVYAMTATSGLFGESGYSSQARLWHAPLAAPSEATMTVVLDQPEKGPEWTGLGAASGRLVAFARQTAGVTTKTTWQVFAGTPDSSGAVALQPTGAALPLSEPAHVVPGTGDACVVSYGGGAPVLQCVHISPQGEAQILLPTWTVPPEALARQTCLQKKFNDAGYSLVRGVAVGGGRLAMLMPACDATDQPLLSLAPFNETTQNVGAWQTWHLPLAVVGTPLVYNDTLLVGAWSARLDATGPHQWLASTLSHRAYLTPQLLADDVVVAFQPVSPSGPGLQEAQVWVNRVLW